MLNSQASVNASRDPVVKNFRVYSMHQETRELTIQVPFNPDHVFILNQTPATLYLVRGGQQLPNILAADLIILPNSYYNFRPNFGGYLYSAVLVYPPGYVDTIYYWQCQIMFAEGFANYALKIMPTPEVMQPLNPLVMPLQADFGFEVLGWGGWEWNFADGDQDFYGAGLQTDPADYIPADGWRSNLNPLSDQNDEGTIASQRPSVWSGIITEIGMGYQDDHPDGTTTWFLSTADAVNTLNPPTTELYNGSTTTHGARFVQGFLPGEITANRIKARVNNFVTIPPNTGQLLTMEYIYVRGYFILYPDTGAPLPEVLVQFIDNSFGLIVSWAWDFGDSTSSTERDPLHNFTSYGVFPVELCVTDVFGEISCVTIDVFINVVGDVVQEYV